MSKLQIRTYDNRDYELSEQELCHLDILKRLSEPTISELISKAPNLLIFPQDLNVYGDKIGDSHIFEIRDKKLVTNNVMGFIGYRNTKISISSRFTKGSNDYFLHYMLQKVFAINLFDLQFNTDNESIFNLLIYLFPTFLKRALRQGIYREYQTRRYNDPCVKGRIDISRHIKLNIPFAGNIAYTTREYAQDNHLTQLIRHTIEYISNHTLARNILCNDDDTIEAINVICSSTPTYNCNQRTQIINQNLRLVSHPYYSEYIPLQQLCIQILQQEEMNYGNDNDEVYGILFDGAWLWEEYLNTFLSKLKFEHSRNRENKGRIYMFSDSKSVWCYPDFMNRDMVLDAKYKGYESWANVQKEDYYQLITYMHLLGLSRGGYVVPIRNNLNHRTLNGTGGDINIWGMDVDFQVKCFKDYCKLMSESEYSLQDKLKNADK